MYVCMQKPVSEQRGAAQCLQCLKWFRSRGVGFAQMHRGGGGKKRGGWRRGVGREKGGRGEGKW